MIMSTLSPCPETHADDGRVEAFIKAARMRLSMGMNEAECISGIQRMGASAEEAFLAVKAANVFLGAP